MSNAFVFVSVTQCLGKVREKSWLSVEKVNTDLRWNAQIFQHEIKTTIFPFPHKWPCSLNMYDIRHKSLERLAWFECPIIQSGLLSVTYYKDVTHTWIGKTTESNPGKNPPFGKSIRHAWTCRVGVTVWQLSAYARLRPDFIPLPPPSFFMYVSCHLCKRHVA